MDWFNFYSLQESKTMINYTEIAKKIRSMSAHDIIMSMVEGLRNPRTKINMQTFGEMRDGVCFGCAATNAILHIIDANEEEIKSHVTYRMTFYDPLRDFEYAIDVLRRGLLGAYNVNATRLGVARITPMPGQKLPKLRDDYTEEQLQEYEKLAKHQLTI